MSDNNKNELQSYKWGSEDLSEATKSEFEGEEFFKFENKKAYTINVLKDEPIKELETKYGTRFLVAFECDGQRSVWACSKTTLRKLQEDIESTTRFNVMLEEAEKRYSIIPNVNVGE